MAFIIWFVWTLPDVLDTCEDIFKKIKAIDILYLDLPRDFSKALH